MSKKQNYPSTDTARGFRDIKGNDLRLRNNALHILSEIYEKYGFEPLETPTIEYADALGKFLPDVDRPAGGVFAFGDDDESWLALRYDLTAPLARFVAKNEQDLPRPYKRYQTGSVFRNEKPGPGRFREFRQCDADIVGSADMAADAELCVMLCEALEALGIAPYDYRINISNRKLLSGVLELAGLDGEESEEKRATVLRAIDKLDRLGQDGVRALLGKGRKDESGDFTQGANLSDAQINMILDFTSAGGIDNAETLSNLRMLLEKSVIGMEGVSELEKIYMIIHALLPQKQNICFNPAIVRGLAYYTGPIFEAELTFSVTNDKGQSVQFGSVAGGGRYDNLVERFTGRTLPATGVSIGLDRLLTALESRGIGDKTASLGLVIVTIMDKDRVTDYAKMVQDLRQAGIPSELYLGGSGIKAQMKYTDKRGASVAIVQGSREKEEGTVILKDLELGSILAQSIDNNEDWRKNQVAQVTVAESDLVSEVQKMQSNIRMRNNN